MTSYFVTRHDGARDWAARQGIDATLISHLDMSRIMAGDTVIGTLPVQMIAELTACGARYLHLELDLPEAARGRALSADEMQRYGARLAEFRAERVHTEGTSQ